MATYLIHLGYTIKDNKQNKIDYIYLKHILNDYNFTIKSMYINFNRDDIVTNRSISFEVNDAQILEIINKIPRDYYIIYVIKNNDEYKILYDYSEQIRSPKLDDFEYMVFSKSKERNNTNKQENKYIKELESQIDDLEKENNVLRKRISLIKKTNKYSIT